MYDKIESNDQTIIEGLGVKDHDVAELDHWVLEDFQDLIPQNLR